MMEMTSLPDIKPICSVQLQFVVPVLITSPCCTSNLIFTVLSLNLTPQELHLNLPLFIHPQFNSSTTTIFGSPMSTGNSLFLPTFTNCHASDHVDHTNEDKLTYHLVKDLKMRQDIFIASSNGRKCLLWMGREQ